MAAGSSKGDFTATLTGLTPGTTYYYQAFATVSGTGDKSTQVETFTGDVKSFTTDKPAIRTWLSNYEVPAVQVSEVTTDNIKYADRYCHATFSETYGTTKACRYDTPRADQKVVTHTYAYKDPADEKENTVRNYTMLFDKTKKAALWVTYATSNSGDFKNNNVGRNDGWGYDPALDKTWQPNLSNSYSAKNGLSFDRGHQVASNDRQTTVEQNKQTFYYSNMTPQYASFNQGQWSTLEGKIQGIATVTKGLDTLYVVTGPLFEGTIEYTTDKDGAQCALPTGYYKCIMKCSFDTSSNMTAASGCAYIVTTNSSNVAPTATTIDAIESRTGFDFFANVPAALQSSAESKATTFF